MQHPASAGNGAPVTADEFALRDQQAQAQAYKPTPEEVKLVGWTQERYKEAADAKDPYLQEWATNLQFFNGAQWGLWDQRTKSLKTNNSIPPWRVRLTDNQIRQLVYTIAAKRGQNRHTTVAVPNDPNDAEDLQGAEVGTKVLRHLDRVTLKKRKRLKAELMSTIYGTAFLMDRWDPTRQTRLAKVDPMSGKVSPVEAFAGEEDFEVLSVWEVFPEPASEWEHVSWCIRATERSLDWIRSTFKERGALVQGQADASDIYAELERQSVTPGGAGQVPQRKTARVLEYYEKPCKDYPQGRHWIVADNVLLYREQREGKDALPHPKGRFPFTIYYGMYTPGRIWGAGWVTDVVDQQRELNRSESQLVESRNLMGRPKWIVARESNLDEDALHSGPGEVVEYDSTSGAPPPQPISPPPVPQYVYDEPERITERIRGISGQHDVSMGTTPSGVTAGVALDILASQDQDRLAIPAQFAGDAWQELDGRMLESVQARYFPQRFIRVFGKTKDDESVLAFQGTDLAGNTDVALDTQEGVQDTTAALRQRIIDYKNAGFFDMETRFSARMFLLMGELQLAQMLNDLAEEQEEAQAEQEAQQAQLQQQQQAEMDGQAQAEQDAQDTDQAHQMLGMHGLDPAHLEAAGVDPRSFAAALPQQFGQQPAPGAGGPAGMQTPPM